MRLIANIINDWKEKRRIEAAYKQEMLTSFAAFIKETRPLAPKADKYPEAALYRHAWKRTAVLEDIAVTSDSTDDIRTYEQCQELATKNYYVVAPSGPYGKIRLALSDSARLTLRESELARIAAEKERSTSSTSRRFRGYVYLDKFGLYYKIGRRNDLNRRLKEISLKLPEPVTTVHAIRTNDPVRLEKYRHERFASKRKRWEWFDLDDEDVAEFKKHSHQM